MSNGPQTPQQQTKQQSYTQASQAMAKPGDVLKEHRAYLEARLEKISKWVTQGVRPEALVRFALMDMQTGKGAEKLRACSKESIYLALLACAVTGLEPGALKGEAYLVPFAKQAQFIPGWKGLVKQARRSGHVEAIGANVVRERDFFDMDLGTANTLVHKPHLQARERGDVIGAYAIARMKGGGHEIEWMDRADLDAIQRVATARGASPAWTDWEDQMQRKSPIRRLAKRLPMGSDYFVTMALEDAEDQIPVLDMETDGEATRAVRGTGSVAEINSARPAQVDEEVVIDADSTEQPAVTTAAPAATAKAPPQQAKAPAQASPPPAAKGARYSTRGPAAPPPANDPKPDTQPAPAQPTLALSGKTEERPCATCEAPIVVPVEIPPGAKCTDCA